MRRMPRILLNVATAVSVVLCVTAVALWARSFWHTDEFRRAIDGGTVWTCTSSHGQIRVALDTDGPGPRPAVEYRSIGGCYYTDQETSEMCGREPPPGWVGGYHDFSSVVRRSRTAGLPILLLAVVAAIPAAARLLRAACRRRRTLAGMCPSCSYDLRATPHRCPECGTDAGRGAA